jgi:diguanylate cyclase (GGDEF)-like protein/PAS domain S-box-containing protein
MVRYVVNEPISELTIYCPDPVISVDKRGFINVFNLAAEKLLGYKASDVVGVMNIAALYERDGEAEHINTMLQSESYGEVGQIEGYKTSVIAANGRVVPIQLSAAQLHSGGDISGSVGFFHDITRRLELEGKIQELSNTDSLTGVYNAQQFQLTLEEEVTRSSRYMHPFGLICFSINSLTEVNSTLGEAAGDEVLRLLGLVMKDTLRDTDTGYRYSGNKFFVMCPETDYAGVTLAAIRLQSTFSKLFPQVINWQSNPLEKSTTLSAGITVFYGGNDVSTSELIHQAVQTMHRSKVNGNDQVCLFESNMMTDL